MSLCLLLIFIIHFQLSIFNGANAQVFRGGLIINSDRSASNVIINDDTLYADAALQIQSKTKGLRFSQLTQTDIDAITNNANTAAKKQVLTGMVVQNTTSGCLNYFNGTIWVAMCQNNAFDEQTIICGGDSLIDNRNGIRDAYSIKSYGTAGCWMTQNLRYFVPGGKGMRINPGSHTRYNAINVASLDSVHSTTRNVLFYEGSNTSLSLENFTKKFGIQYDWNTAMGGSTIEGAQGVCPAGWHLPGDMEWNALEKEIANNSTYGGVASTWNTSWDITPSFRNEGTTTGHGRLMKLDEVERGESSDVWGGAANKWIWSGTGAGSDQGTNGINKSGFNLLPAGHVNSDGIEARYFGGYATQWTSSYVNSDQSVARQIPAFSPGVSRNVTMGKGWYSSVRCKKGGGNGGGVNATNTEVLRSAVFTDPGNCPTSITDSRDGQTSTYTAKYFGALAGCWMTQNLRYYHPSGNGMRINPGRTDNVAGSAINPTSAANVHSTTSGADDITYYEGSANTTVRRNAFTNKFGLLYNWDTAMNLSTTPGAQGVCPDGWHLPTDAEWNVLEQVIANDPDLGGVAGTWRTSWETVGGAYRPASPSTTGHGRVMKSNQDATPTYGQATTIAGGTTYNWNGGDGGTNTFGGSGFNALPAAAVYPNGTTPYSFGIGAYFWSSSQNDATTAWERSIHSASGNTGVRRLGEGKTWYISVRCKKN